MNEYSLAKVQYISLHRYKDTAHDRFANVEPCYCVFAFEVDK